MKISGDSVHPQHKIICLCHPVQFIMAWDTKYIQSMEKTSELIRKLKSISDTKYALPDWLHFWVKRKLCKNVYWTIFLMVLEIISLIDIPMYIIRPNKSVGKERMKLNNFLKVWFIVVRGFCDIMNHWINATCHSHHHTRDEKKKVTWSL